MKVIPDHPLGDYNTFWIQSTAQYFVQVNNIKELKDFLTTRNTKLPIFFLSGGSNVILPEYISGYTLHINILGKKPKPYQEGVSVHVGAGENWHDFVVWCVDQGYKWIENLALIPGNVGTSPIQNIGAYGVQVEDVLQGVYVVDTQTGEEIFLQKEECGFGYRDSIFKNPKNSNLAIVGVEFFFSPNTPINTSYGAIESELKSNNIHKPSTKDVMEAVIHIRQSKLPDPTQTPNVGSVFKNPVVSRDQFISLQKEHPNIPHFPLDNDLVKIPAAWCIDQLGLKGQKMGSIGVHKNQPLVLFNHKGATQEDFELAVTEIQNRVHTQFQINLVPEVRIIKS